MLKLPEIIVDPKLKPHYDLVHSLHVIIFDVKAVWYSSPSNAKIVDTIMSVDIDLSMCVDEILDGHIPSFKFNRDMLAACFKKARYKGARELKWDELKIQALKLYDDFLKLKKDT
jgi:hypothetical protein